MRTKENKATKHKNYTKANITNVISLNISINSH